MAKNSFAADITIKTCPQKSSSLLFWIERNIVKQLKVCPAFIKKQKKILFLTSFRPFLVVCKCAVT